jgi:competence protein ComEA
MKKILFFMALSVSFLFSAVNLQTATKDELMCLKGIGEKKAMAIITHRKSNKIKSVDDLMELKGFGKGIIASIKKGTKTVKCGGKKSTSAAKKTTSKKSVSKKDTSKKDTPKKEGSKKEGSKKEGSKKETVKKDTVKKETSEKSTKKTKSESKIETK